MNKSYKSIQFVLGSIQNSIVVSTENLREPEIIEATKQEENIYLRNMKKYRDKIRYVDMRLHTCNF